jgi:hypothetical protein
MTTKIRHNIEILKLSHLKFLFIDESAKKMLKFNTVFEYFLTLILRRKNELVRFLHRIHCLFKNTER